MLRTVRGASLPCVVTWGRYSRLRMNADRILSLRALARCPRSFLRKETLKGSAAAPPLETGLVVRVDAVPAPEMPVIRVGVAKTPWEQGRLVWPQSRSSAAREEMGQSPEQSPPSGEEGSDSALPPGPATA